LEETDIFIKENSPLERPRLCCFATSVPRSLDSAATSSLARFVEDVRILAPVAGRMRRIEQLPDGRTNLHFRVMDGGREADVTLAGPRTHAVFKDPTGVAQVVSLRFKPGWSTPLFGVPTSGLTDRYVKLADLWGRQGADLCDELLAARSVPDVLGRLSRAIAAHADNEESASASLARRAVRLLEAGEARVAHVAATLGVTTRHLRRAFTDSVGIGPKEYARTVRLQRAVRLAVTSRDWAHIAVCAGYYDQAHLIADFRDLVGLTPGAYVSQRVDAPRRPELAAHGPA
jgi:AraC-like DNA-binding protein